MSIIDKIEFDWKLNIYSLITIILFIAGIVAWFFNEQNHRHKLEQKFEAHEILQTENRIAIAQLERDTRDYYLSKDVADQIISRLERIENRLDAIQNNK